MTGAKILRLATFPSGLPILISPQRNTLWEGARLEAHCPPLVDYDMKAGIHAYRCLRLAVQLQNDPDQRRDVPASTAYVVLRPEGETLVGEYGWAAAAATIVRIFLPLALYAKHARALYDRYRVPVDPLPRSLAAPRPSPPPQWPSFAMRSNSETVPGRSPAGKAWMALYRPGCVPQRYGNGRLCLRGGPLFTRLPIGDARPLVVYDAEFAAHNAAVAALRKTRVARESEERQRDYEESAARSAARRRREYAADQLRALDILSPYLPIKTVRVSSAHARGKAGKYPYWGVARYQIRATADGKGVTNAVQSGASSDRRSQRLAADDADCVAIVEGRIYCDHIGRLSSDLAEGIALQIRRPS